MTESIPQLNVSQKVATERLTRLYQRAIELEALAASEVEASEMLAARRKVTDPFGLAVLKVNPWLASAAPDMSAIDAEHTAALARMRALDSDFSAWYSEAVGLLETLGTGKGVLRRFQDSARAWRTLDPDELAESLRDRAKDGAANLQGVIANLSTYAQVKQVRRSRTSAGANQSPPGILRRIADHPLLPILGLLAAIAGVLVAVLAFR